MLLQRFLVALILGPAALLITYIGGPYYLIAITLLLLIAAWECTLLLLKAGISPSTPLVMAGVLVLAASRWFAIQPIWLITAFILISASIHALQFEQGQQNTLVNLGGTLLTTFYIGWLGSYLVSLRTLPQGQWWLALILLMVWTIDTAAYFFGKQFGKHKFSPRLSPNKTWEGYFAGIPAGIAAGIGFSALLQAIGAQFNLLYLPGGVLGLLLGLAIPMGDLTESLIKRQAGEKDSSSIFPGHGGMFDRLDTILWAMPISSFFIHNIYPYLEKL